MSGAERKRSKIRVAVLLLASLSAFAALVEGMAIWLRAGTAPEAYGANAVNTDPRMTWENLFPQPKVPRAKAGEIAIAEVKRREGWAGQVDAPTWEGSYWFVVVRRKPGAAKDWRYLTVHNNTGQIISYEVRTDPLP
jgi:hypothetical protein